MNAAQLTATREIARNMEQGVVKQSMTAKEMALTPHNLNRDGSMAITNEGRKWIWDARFDKWSRWF